VRADYWETGIHWGLLGGPGNEPEGSDPFGRMDRFGRVGIADVVWIDERCHGEEGPIAFAAHEFDKGPS